MLRKFTNSEPSPPITYPACMDVPHEPAGALNEVDPALHHRCRARRPIRGQNDPWRRRQRIPAIGATLHAVGEPQTFGEVRFRRDGDRLSVDHATPVMWFAHHVLENSRAEPDVGLSFDGTHVTLRASNGRWIWKLTGRSWRRPFSAEAESLVMLEGVWPD